MIYNPIFFKIALATSCVGISCGILGCFITLSRQSLVADTIAHSTLPGICLSFLILGYKSTIGMIVGAFICAITAMTIIHKTTHPNIKKETILGIILSSMFGLGTLLLSLLQHDPTSKQAGLDTYIFGHASTILYEDLYILLSLTILICGTTFYFYKEFLLLIFDPLFSKTTKMKLYIIQYLLYSLLACAIIVGLQTVGLILIGSFLVAPAVAARQWTHHLSTMITISILYSIGSCLIGTLLSCWYQSLATGPCIVIISTLATLSSCFIRPYLIKKENKWN